MRLYTYLLSLLLSLPVSLLLGQVTLTESNLPIVVINTSGMEIPDEPKIPAKMGIIYNGPGATNKITDPFNHYDGDIGIELRGSTSQFYDKKPYGLETRDETGENLNVSLLGMPEENDWALIAPFNDKTLMRDALAHAYASQALPWSPRTRYCELIINGTYQGVYMLIEIIKRDKNRVDINNLRPDEISGDDLTGGYLLRMDKDGPPPGAVGGDWLSVYPPVPNGWQQTWFQYFDPKADELHPLQAAYIKDHIQNFEGMLQAPNYGEHYADWIDVDSWVDYLLVEELGKNTDGYRLSAYFYKQRDSDDGKIYMGPVWDFNIAFGIGDYCDGASWEGWAKDFNQICPNDGWLIHFWWQRLWNDPAFRQRVAERWQEHRSGPWSDENLFGVIDSLSVHLQQAQVRNFQRWPILGQYVWPNAYIGNTYSDEVTYLREWLRKRLGWLDTEIPLLVSPTKEQPIAGSVKIYPNPGTGTIWLELPQEAGSGNWTFDLFDQDGRHLWRKEALYPKVGPVPINLLDGQAFTSGLYFCRLTAADGTQSAQRIYLQRP